MKIVILDGYTENPGDLSWQGFEEFGDLTVYDRTAAEDILPRAKGAEAVIVNKTPLSAETIRALASELRYIGVLATGFNVVDLAAAKELGVPVCNIPAYGTKAVAQFTMALLLELCHRVGDHSRSVRSGDWSRSQDFCYWNSPQTELAGKTFGIFGYGRIGREVGRLAAAFGMNVLACSHHPNRTETDEAGTTMVSMEELFATSDILSLHCPLSPETQGLICRETLQRMKKGVLLLNTARGPLIVEEDLAEALREGWVGGAAVDVLSTEPPAKDNPLLSAPNCLITPHIAWAPKESRQRLMDLAVANLRAFLAGTPQNVVNR
jgi:glycerate dehydrogenase